MHAPQPEEQQQLQQHQQQQQHNNNNEPLEPKWLPPFVVRSLVCHDVLFVLDVFPAFVNPYAIVFLFPPVPAILEAIIFEIMSCSKHPSKHPSIQTTKLGKLRRTKKLMELPTKNKKLIITKFQGQSEVS